MHEGGSQIVVAVYVRPSMCVVMIVVLVIVSMVMIVSGPMVMGMVVTQQESTKQVDT
jgi:hypothetical protein